MYIFINTSHIISDLTKKNEGKEEEERKGGRRKKKMGKTICICTILKYITIH